MAADMEPVVGVWYFNADSERSFEVINFDEDDELVEVRYEDGDNEEFLLDAWYELNLEPGAPTAGWQDDDDEDTRKGGVADAGDQDEGAPRGEE